MTILISLIVTIVFVMLFTILRLHYSSIIENRLISANYIHAIKKVTDFCILIAMVSLLCFIVSFVATYIIST